MSRLIFAGELESAADQIADISRADLQIVLRRAALMLRNVAGVDLGTRTDELLFGIAAEMEVSKSDLIKTIVSDWLIANAYLPVPLELDEGNETPLKSEHETRRLPLCPRKIRLVPLDEPPDALGHCRRRAVADRLLQRRGVGEGIGHIAGLQRQEFDDGFAAERRPPSWLRWRPSRSTDQNLRRPAWR